MNENDHKSASSGLRLGSDSGRQGILFPYAQLEAVQPVSSPHTRTTRIPGRDLAVITILNLGLTF